jgi:phosphonate transport system substrate-binding protein
VVPTLVSAQPSGDPLVLAVHPYLPAAEIQRRFAPLAAYLSKALRREVVVRVGRTYDEHIDAIGRDQVDIAFLGPVPYVKVLEAYGRKPLLARFEVDGEPNLYGVIFVRRDSQVKDLRDLKGRRVAFGDPESTMSHIVPRAMLMNAGVPVGTLAEYKFLGSHSNVALAVLAGDFDAGAVKKEVFNEFAPRGLRALATTPPTPDHLFVTRADFPPADVTRARETLLSLRSQPDGAAMLDRLHKGLTALIPAAESDYARLRASIRVIDPPNR